MAKKQMTRRQFVKAGLLTAAGAGLGVGALKPTGLYAATPKVAGPIKVGYQSETSGFLAAWGDFHIMGATMAMEEINAAGGIAGQKLEIEFHNTALHPDQAVRNARRFVEKWGADFLAGVDISEQALALAPVVAELDRVLMVTHAPAAKLTEEEVFQKGIKQIFRVATPTYQDAYAAALVARDIPAKTWGGLNLANDYGTSCWSMFQETLAKVKPEVKFPAAVAVPWDTTDYRPHINTLMNAEPEGIFCSAVSAGLIHMVRQAQKIGLFDHVKHVMLTGGGGMDVLEGLGKVMPDNVWITSRYWLQYPATPANQDFVTRFFKRWSHYPADVSEAAYAAMYAFKKAVEAAGSKETKAVIQALEGMSLKCPAGTRVFRKEDHQAVYDVPWGLTKSDPTFGFKVMGQMVVVPAKDCFARPPFTGPAARPPFQG
ncbi:MAG: ABC transporter substrate-binding protein [Deltaproteobacteria bacterium]|nr:ABC transporter substrate-binding protein [Deltaproteobacteria bacterium]